MTRCPYCGTRILDDERTCDRLSCAAEDWAEEDIRRQQDEDERLDSPEHGQAKDINRRIG